MTVAEIKAALDGMSDEALVVVEVDGRDTLLLEAARDTVQLMSEDERSIVLVDAIRLRA